MEEVSNMERPNNIDDYSQCVKENRRGLVQIFCVECDDWYNVAVRATIDVTFFQGGKRMRNWDDNLVCVCGNPDCQADIEYLLSLAQKDMLKSIVRIQ